MEKLLRFLADLRKANIYFELKHIRDETVMVAIAVPGERWEVKFFADGSVEAEVFKSNGAIEGKKVLERLFREFRD